MSRSLLCATQPVLILTTLSLFRYRMEAVFAWVKGAKHAKHVIQDVIDRDNMERKLKEQQRKKKKAECAELLKKKAAATASASE